MWLSVIIWEIGKEKILYRWKIKGKKVKFNLQDYYIGYLYVVVFLSYNTIIDRIELSGVDILLMEKF